MILLKISIQEILKFNLDHEWQFSTDEDQASLSDKLYGARYYGYANCEKCKITVYLNGNYIAITCEKYSFKECVFNSTDELKNFITSTILTCNETLIKRLLE